MVAAKEGWITKGIDEVEGEGWEKQKRRGNEVFFSGVSLVGEFALFASRSHGICQLGGYLRQLVTPHCFRLVPESCTTETNLVLHRPSFVSGCMIPNNKIDGIIRTSNEVSALLSRILKLLRIELDLTWLCRQLLATSKSMIYSLVGSISAC
jgi:hypothetical protein